MRRLLTALLLAPALVLAGCGSDDDASTGDDVLAQVEVSGEQGEAPTVEVDPPLDIEDSASTVLIEGDGQALQDGQLVTIDYVGIDGRTGEQFDSSFERGEPAVFGLTEGSLIDGFREGLLGAHVGSRVLIGVSPADGYGPQGGLPDAGIEEQDSLVFVVDVLDATTVLERAQGESVEPTVGLPSVTLDDQGAPTVAVPDAAAPSELVAQPLIRGEGEKVQSGDTIYVNYEGLLWSDGSVFDSSWDRGGEPVSFQIGTGQVIPGWDQGLVGQTVGSQVLLVIPPSLGYGDQAQDAIPAGSTLVFVVDILASVSPDSAGSGASASPTTSAG